MIQTIIFYFLFFHFHRFTQFFIKKKNDFTSINQMFQKKHWWFVISTLSIFFFQICIHTSKNIVVRKFLNIWIFFDIFFFFFSKFENSSKIENFWKFDCFDWFNFSSFFSIDEICSLIVEIEIRDEKLSFFESKKKNSYEWINVNDEFSIIEFLIIVEIVLLIERTNKYIEIFI